MAINITLRIQNAGIARLGFGLPLIVSHNAPWADRRRLYSSFAEVVDDGFAADSPEAIAVAAIFAQSPHPRQVMIGRAASAVTQRYEIDAAAVTNAFTYSINVSGEGFDADTVEYTSDGSATTAEIHNGLVAALNAVVDKNFTAAFAALVYSDDTFTAAASDICTNVAHALLTGDGPFQLTSSGTLPAGLALATNYWIIKLTDDTFSFASTLANALAGTAVDITDAGTGTHTISDTASTARPDDPFTVTGNASGDWFALELGDVSALSIAQTHTATGLADELVAISDVDNSWYWLVTLYNSTAYVLAAAAYVEASDKAYIAATSDTAVITTTYTPSVSPDVGAELADLGYKRTLWNYHHNPAQVMGAALTGRLAPLTPGSWTAKFKALSGVTVSPLTTTHTTNIEARRGNGYRFEDGRDMTFDGKVPSEEFGFLDVVVGLDAFLDDLRKGQVGVQVSVDKVSYEDEDIAMLEAAALASTTKFSSNERKVLRADPAPTVFFPKVADIPPVDRALRKIPDVVIHGELAGAVHDIDIDVTLEF
jgi:hypothetical protein